MADEKSTPESTIPPSTEVVKQKVPKIAVVSNWRKVFFTWSFWLHMGSVLLTFVDQLLPYIGLLEPTMTVQTYAICMFALNALGLFSRFIKQKNLWEIPKEEPNE